MKTVDIDAADTDLSALVDEAVAGEEIVLAKDGKPVVRLTPIATTDKKDIGSTFGMLKGQVWMSDDFDAPLPDEIKTRRKPGALKGMIKMHDDFDAPLPPDLARAFGMDE